MLTVALPYPLSRVCPFVIPTHTSTKDSDSLTEYSVATKPISATEKKNSVYEHDIQ